MAADVDGAPLLMTVEARIGVTGSPDKLVLLPSETDWVPMGMHDELAAFYGADPDSVTPHASTLDYIVGALGACLGGTFKRALAARGVDFAPDDLETVATGRIVVVRDVPVIESVVVRSVLRGVRDEDRPSAERAHAVHHRACAVSRSLEGAFAISTELNFE